VLALAAGLLAPPAAGCGVHQESCGLARGEKATE
jgi:hypothetical protein